MNLIDALDAYGVKYKNSNKPGEIWLCCPFCMEEGQSGDARFRLGVNIETGEMHCFNCDKASRDSEYTFRELDRMLDLGELQAAAVRAKVQTKEVIEIPEGFELASKSGSFWSKKAYKYLRSRGVRSSQIKDNQIGVTEVGRFAYRIIFPVFYKGKLKGIVARAMVADQKPKYLNSIGTKVLYNVPAIRNKRANLSEGILDSLALARSHYGDGLGLLGHSLTDRQLRILSRYRHVVTWMDPDKAGAEGTKAIGQQLIASKHFDKISVIATLLDGDTRDPSDMPQDDIDRYLDKGLREYSEALCNRLKLRALRNED